MTDQTDAPSCGTIDLSQYGEEFAEMPVPECDRFLHSPGWRTEYIWPSALGLTGPIRYVGAQMTKQEMSLITAVAYRWFMGEAKRCADLQPSSDVRASGGLLPGPNYDEAGMVAAEAAADLWYRLGEVVGR